MASSGIATVEIPIKATITGYEASLNKLKQALAHIDIGTDLGKQASAAFAKAQKEVKSLQPKYSVTSEAGVDKVFGRIEQVGSSILHVNDLLQQMQIPNIDLSTLGTEIQQIITLASELKNSMNVSMNDGIRDAVASSKELSDVFKSLGVNIDKMTVKEGTDALNKGLKNASKDVEQAQKQVDELTQKYEQLQTVRDMALNNKLANTAGRAEFGQSLLAINPKGIDKGQLATLLKESTQSFTDALHGAVSGHKKSEFGIELQKLIDDAVNGLDVTNVKTKLEDFKTKFEDLIKDFTFKDRKSLPQVSQIFDADTLIQQVLGITDQSMAEALDKVKTIIDQFGGQLSPALQGAYEKFQNLSKGNTTPEAFQKFINDVITSLTKGGIDAENKGKEAVEKINEVGTALKAAMDSLTEKQAARDTIATAIKNYEAKIAELEQKLQALEERLNVLNQQIAAAAGQTVKEVKGDSQKGADDANKAWQQATGSVRMYKNEVERAHDKGRFVGSIESFVQRWFSVYAVVRMVRQAISKVVSTVAELDKTITNISIVTDMSSSDLWGQMDKYAETARKFATSISGVYEVSQLYYQQGLGTAQVDELTEATLKMARIAGMDYSKATNYMTNAIRSFKMDMSEASTVTDVYSAISAKSATSTSELAEAMSKTASSAQAVGSSFENTTAMMAVMIEATREAPQNIGSAMKSIISRYGEMTSDPTATKDSEGEDMSLNRVDKALKTVGITLQTAEGQFRDFDDVIMDLAEKWDDIDKNTQRYIATIMAGNRQQSRFLALVSSYERLKELSNEAAESEDASQLQFLKTLESVDAKKTQLQNTVQQLYVGSGFEDLYKGLLDLSNTWLQTFTNMARWGKLPIPALGKLAIEFISLAKIAGTSFGLIKQFFTQQASAITNTTATEAAKRTQIRQNEVNEDKALTNDATTHYINSEGSRTGNVAYRQGGRMARRAQLRAEQGSDTSLRTRIGMKGSRANAITSLGLSIGGLLLESIGNSMDVSQTEGGSSERKWKAVFTGAGRTAQMAGLGLSMGGGWGALIGGVIGAAWGVAEAIGIIQESAEDKAKRLTEKAEELNNKAIEDRANYRTLKNSLEKVRKLEETRYNSEEDAEAYQEAIDTLTSKFPQLSAGFDSAGNALANLTNAEQVLADARAKSAMSTYEASKAQMEATKAQMQAVEFKGAAPSDLVKIDAGTIANSRNRYWEEVKGPSFQAGLHDLNIPLGAISYLFTNAQKDYLPVLSEDVLVSIPILMGGLTALDAQYQTKRAIETARQRGTILPSAVDNLYNSLVASQDLLGRPHMSKEDWVRESNLTRQALNGHSYFNFFPNTDGYMSQLAKFFDEAQIAGSFSQQYFQDNIIEDTNDYWDRYIQALAEAKDAGIELTNQEQEILEWGTYGLGDFIVQEQKLIMASDTLSKKELRGTPEYYTAMQDYSDALTALQMMPDLPESTKTFIETAANWWNDAGEILTKIEDFNNTFKANTKAYLSGKQNQILNDHPDWLKQGNYYEESAGSIAMMNEYLETSYYKGQAASSVENTRSTQELIEQDIQSYNNWFMGLTEKQRKRFEEMYSDTSNYIADDIIAEFEIQDEKIKEIINSYYSDGIESIQARLTQQLAKRGISEGSTGSSKEFYNAAMSAKTVVEEAFFNSILEDIDHLKEIGAPSSMIENLQRQAANLYNEIEKQDADSRKAIYSIMKEGNVSTISGIFDIKYNLKENHLLSQEMENALNGMRESVISNLVSELESFGYTVSKKVDDFDKALQNASKGMALDDAITMANQLNMDLSQFTFKDGKFFLNDFSSIRDHYLEYLNEEQEELAQVYNSRIQTLENLKIADKITYDMSDFSTWMQQGGHTTIEIEQQYARLQQQQQQQWESIWSAKGVSQYIDKETNKVNTTAITDLFNQDFMTSALTSMGLNVTEVNAAYQLYAEKMADHAIDADTSFLDWYKEYNETQWESLTKASQKYFTYQAASAFINNGQIEAFIKRVWEDDENLKQYDEEITELYQNQIIKNIKNAANGVLNWSDIYKIQLEDGEEIDFSEQFAGYTSLLIKNITGASKKIQSEITKNIGKKTTYIATNDYEKQKLDELIDAGAEYVKKVEDGVYEFILDSEEVILASIKDLYNDSDLTFAERNKEVGDRLKQLYNESIYGYSEKIVGQENISFEDAMNFLGSIDETFKTASFDEQIEQAKGYGLIWNDSLKQFIVDATQAEEDVAEVYQDLIASTEDPNLKRLYMNLSSLTATAGIIKRRNALTDILKNPEEITSDQKKAFLEAFNLTDEDIFIINEGKGNYTIDYNKLFDTIQGFDSEVADILDNYVVTTIDDYISNLSTAASYVVKGTTKIEDLEKFKKKYEELTNKTLNIFEQFSWDNTVGSFVLNDLTILTTYAQAYRQKMIDKFGQENIGQIDQAIGRAVANEIIDMSTIINFSGKNTKTSRATVTKTLQSLQQLNAIDSNINIDNILTTLAYGGDAAVLIAQTLADLTGTTLTDDDIQTLATGYVQALTTTMESIKTLDIGAFVGTNENINQLLKNAGFQISATGFITSLGNVAEAYQIFYEQLKQTNNASLQQINDAYLKILNYQEANQTAAIEALSNGASMTYEALNTILTNVGMSLEVVSNNLEKFGLTTLGAGKIRITNWAAFAKKLNLDINSEEYTSAFNTYNQSMIELNRQTEKNILQEFKTAMNTSSFDITNISYLISAYGESFIEEYIFKGLKEGINYTLQEGRLSFKDANGKTAKQAQKLFLENEYRFLMKTGKYSSGEIADLKDEYKKQFATNLTDGVKKALEGTLTNREMSDLIETASLHGIQIKPSDFKETAQGLKISTEAAINLYNQLVKIDNIAASIAFENLIESLSEANEEYKTLVGTLNRIKQLNTLIATPGVSDARLQQYQAELEVAEEIARVRATSKDEGLDFMNQKMPDVLSNPQNMMKSVTGAFTAWGTAWKTQQKAFDFTTGKWSTSKGLMGIQDYYNMVNMFNELAGAAGTTLEFAGANLNGSAETATAAILSGMNALKTLESGEQVIDLGAIGLDMKSGASQMAANFDESLNTIAREQVDMLDGMIALLETIVAMEELGDVAGEDHVINFGDIVLEGGSFSTEWKTYVDKIKEQTTEGNENYDKELDIALQSIKVGQGKAQKSIKDIFNMTAQQWDQLGEDGAKDYTNALNALYQAYLSGDYSQENIWSSLKDVMASTGFDGVIELDSGEKTVTIGFKNGLSLEADENNKWTVDGQEYKDWDLAYRALLLQKAGGKNGLVTEEGGAATIYIGDGKPITIRIDNNDIIYYGEDGTYTSLDSYLQSLWEADEQSKLNFEEWKIDKKYKVIPQINLMSNKEDIKLTSNQKKNLASVTSEDLQEEWNKANTPEMQLKFKAKYGIDLTSWNGSDSELSTFLDELLELNGIEPKTIKLTAISETDDGTKQIIELLKNGQTIKIAVKVNSVGGKYGWLFGANTSTPVLKSPEQVHRENRTQTTPVLYEQGESGPSEGIPIPSITVTPEEVLAEVTGLMAELKGTMDPTTYALLELAVQAAVATGTVTPGIDGLTINDPEYTKTISFLISLVALKAGATLNPDTGDITLPENLPFTKPLSLLIKKLNLLTNPNVEIDEDTLNNLDLEDDESVVTVFLSSIKLDPSQAKLVTDLISLPSAVTLQIARETVKLCGINLDTAESDVENPEIPSVEDQLSILLAVGLLQQLGLITSKASVLNTNITLPNGTQLSIASAWALLKKINGIDDGETEGESLYEITLPNGSTITIPYGTALLEYLGWIDLENNDSTSDEYYITLPDDTQIKIGDFIKALAEYYGIEIPEGIDPDNEYVSIPGLGNFKLSDVITALAQSVTIDADGNISITNSEITLPGDKKASIANVVSAVLNTINYLATGNTAVKNKKILAFTDAQVTNVVTAILSKIRLTTDKNTEIDSSGINIPSIEVEGAGSGASSGGKDNNEETDLTLNQNEPPQEPPQTPPQEPPQTPLGKDKKYITLDQILADVPTIPGPNQSINSAIATMTAINNVLGSDSFNISDYKQGLPWIELSKIAAAYTNAQRTVNPKILDQPNLLPTWYLQYKKLEAEENRHRAYSHKGAAYAGERESADLELEKWTKALNDRLQLDSAGVLSLSDDTITDINDIVNKSNENTGNTTDTSSSDNNSDTTSRVEIIEEVDLGEGNESLFLGELSPQEIYDNLLFAQSSFETEDLQKGTWDGIHTEELIKLNDLSDPVQEFVRTFMKDSLSFNENGEQIIDAGLVQQFLSDEIQKYHDLLYPPEETLTRSPIFESTKKKIQEDIYSGKTDNDFWQSWIDHQIKPGGELSSLSDEEIQLLREIAEQTDQQVQDEIDAENAIVNADTAEVEGESNDNNGSTNTGDQPPHYPYVLGSTSFSDSGPGIGYKPATDATNDLTDATTGAADAATGAATTVTSAGEEVTQTGSKVGSAFTGLVNPLNLVHGAIALLTGIHWQTLAGGAEALKGAISNLVPQLGAYYSGWENGSPGNNKNGENPSAKVDIKIGDNEVEDYTNTTHSTIVKALLNSSAIDAYLSTPHFMTVLAKATGTVAAKGTIGSAMASGTRTLMGELGPELYVSNGRYHLAGEGGAEFVNLPKDAIVFNHLQTRKLMSTGAAGRGKPITNERNAVAFAKGSGPAMASASAVLATLKQLRSMWQQIANMSTKDLAGLGGGGGGGGGNKNFIKDLEKWFNLLQKIAQLEKEINHQEKLRSKIESDRIINGKALYESQKKSIDALREQVRKEQELANLQKSQYDIRRMQLEQTPFGQVFSYDENGVLQYKKVNNQGQKFSYNGKEFDSSLEFLAEVSRQDDYGNAVHDAKEQLKMLQDAFGPSIMEYMKYDSEGNEIKGDPVKQLQAFYDRLEGQQNEMTQLWDSYNETMDTVLELQQKENELLQKMVDNQLEVEDKVLKAIEEREQATIDAATKEKEAFEKATKAMIDGLSQQLEKERNLYQRSQEKDDLNKMRRQLAILQRSGGSQSQIRQLQDEINAKSQEAYFNAQQDQIDALKDATDKQIERLDEQINLMKETLEYQKDNGLLWTEVYQIMEGTPESIMNFIQTYTPEYRSNSELKIQEDLRTLTSIVEQWTSYRDDTERPDTTQDQENTQQSLDEAYKNFIENNINNKYQAEGLEFSEETKNAAYAAFIAKYRETGDLKAAQEEAEKYYRDVYQTYINEHPEYNPYTPQTPTGPQGNGNGGGGGGSNYNNAKVVITHHYLNLLGVGDELTGTSTFNVALNSTFTPANHQSPKPGWSYSQGTSAFEVKDAFQVYNANLYYSKNGGMHEMTFGTDYTTTPNTDHLAQQRPENDPNYTIEAKDALVHEYKAKNSKGEYIVYKTEEHSYKEKRHSKKYLYWYYCPICKYNNYKEAPKEPEAQTTKDSTIDSSIVNNDNQMSNINKLPFISTTRFLNPLALLTSLNDKFLNDLALQNLSLEPLLPERLFSFDSYNAEKEKILRQLERNLGQPITNIVNINNPVVRDDNDIQKISDTLETKLLAIAKKTSANMSVR